jgi:hypothetical protein
MKTLLCFCLCAVPAFAGEREAARVRVAIAIATALHEMPKEVAATPLDYSAAYALSLSTGKPLVVFVRTPVREVAGCVCCGIGVGYESIWIGIPRNGEIYRQNLPADATDDDILAACHKLDKSMNAPPVVQAGWSNVGDCPCQRNTGRCQCVPASKCSRGQCPQPAALQPRSYAPTYSIPAYSVPCRT